MNDIAGAAGVKLADMPTEQDGNVEADENQLTLHRPCDSEEMLPTSEEMAIADEDIDLPALTSQYDDDDSDSESGEEGEENLYGEDDAADEEAADISEILEEAASEGSSKVQEEPRRPLRRSTRETAGHQRYDSDYEWNLMNLSVGAAIRNFGDVARQACMAELTQLFREKKALVAVHLKDLTEQQRKNIIRSHMFLTEKFEDGKFVKMKGRVVADGRMQDRNVYSDYSAPTAKTRSVMTCLKIAAVKGWDLLKLDVGGAFLCAPIGEEEVYMSLDRELTEKAAEGMPELAEFVQDGKLIVRVERAMYGLIQSAKLWYNELTRYLESKGFKKSQADECVLVKRMGNDNYIVIVLYVDDILVLGGVTEDRHWVKQILIDEYQKITFDEGKRLTYLGMTINKVERGFEVSMKSYIEDILSFYGKEVNTCITPAKVKLFEPGNSEQRVDAVIFHSVVAKLLYLGKRGRPDILLPVQFLCTRVKGPTMEDQRKLERVLGYLKLTKAWRRVFNDSQFDKVETYIDASFALHADGKSQSGCMVFLGNTLVHDGCRKQRIVTRNSTEAELVALSDYIEEGELIEAFLADIGDLMLEELITATHLVYQDNQPTMDIVMDAGCKQRSKYMKVRAAYVAERVGTGELALQYIHTSRMIADLLTKPLGGDLFHKHAQAALGRLPAVCNRGAKGRTTGKHADVGSITKQLGEMTCTQPGKARGRKQRPA